MSNFPEPDPIFMAVRRMWEDGPIGLLRGTIAEWQASRDVVGDQRMESPQTGEATQSRRRIWSRGRAIDAGGVLPGVESPSGKW